MLAFRRSSRWLERFRGREQGGVQQHRDVLELTFELFVLAAAVKRRTRRFRDEPKVFLWLLGLHHGWEAPERSWDRRQIVADSECLHEGESSWLAFISPFYVSVP